MNIILLLFYTILSFNLNPVWAEEKHRRKGLNLGFYEKGNYMGIFSNLSDNEQIELGINYFKVPVGKFDIGFSEDIKIKFSSIGTKLNYRKYIKSKDSQGFFMQAGIELNNSSLYSKIKLSELSYQTGNVVILCPTCDSLDLKIKPKIINLIPNTSLGWSKKVTKNIYFNSSIGIQFLKIDKATWTYNSKRQLPYFVRDEIDKAVEEINSTIKNLPKIYPTAMITFSYIFD